MQVNPQEVSGAKASTARTRPTMASHRLDLPSICDICGKARSTRRHGAFWVRPVAVALSLAQQEVTA